MTKLETAGSLLMRSCIAYLERKFRFNSDFWFNAVMPAAHEIGERWPGKACIYNFKHPGDDTLKDYVEQPWVSLIAAVDSDRERMASLTESRHSFVRASAFWFLGQKWPDQTIRDLLSQRAVQDDDGDPRSAALQALAEKWPDQATRDLLTLRALEAPDISERGAACSAMGKLHSQFGRILPTRDLDGTGPYLDPLEPIPRMHIEKAAARAGIRPDDIDAQVASLSAHLGRDVTVGAKME
jgi:hypothetical protein